MSTTMTDQKTDEELLRDLENEAAAPPPSGGGGADEEALLNEGINPNIDLETVVPAGEYLARFEEVIVKRSAVREERDPKTQVVVQKGGNLMLECKLAILGGEHDGRNIYDRIMLEGKGAARMARVASVLGRYDRDLKCLTGFPSSPPTAGEIKSWLIGKVVTIEVEIEPERTFQGKKQAPRSVVAFSGYHEPPAPPNDVPAVASPQWK